MAKKYENIKNFLIIEGVESDFLEIGCGYGGGIEERYENGLHVINVIGGKKLCCDFCMNNDFQQDEPVYYVAVLNKILCKKCFDRFMSDQVRHREDVHIEERNYNNIKTALSLRGLFKS